MQRILHRLAALALAAALVLGLVGCGDASNSFTWFVEEIPSNLDPQVASAPADVIACKNLYGGLLRLSPDGQLQNDLCESWSVSADGLRYTFTLRDGLTYTAAKGEPTEYAITAEDFVYAFQRVFLPETRSPYAAEFSALENAAAILAGQMDVSALGVSRGHALRRGVFPQHPGHLWADGLFHPFQRQLLPLQLDFQRVVPLAGRRRHPDRQPAPGPEHQRRRSVR